MSNLKTSATKPAKKSKRATAPSGSTAKAFKSAEIIVDSDEDENPAAKTSAKRPVAPPKSKGASLSLGKDQRSSGSKPSSSKSSKGPKPLTPSTSDGASNSQFVSEAESDPNGPAFGVRSNTPQKPSLGAPASISRPSLKRKSPSASASVTETSEGDTEQDGRSKPAKRRKPSPTHRSILNRAKSTGSKLQTIIAQESEGTDFSQSGSGEETETESEDQSHDERGHSGSNEEPAIATGKKSIPQPSLLPYAPPPGFEPATISLHASSSHTELFSSSNLQGKQIWHIAIPSSVPVTSITSVAKKSVKDGSAVMSYKGTDYGLIPETENQTKKTVLLLPSDEDDRYKLANTHITQTLHLQRLVRLPSIVHEVGAQDAGTQVGGTVTVRKSIEKPAPEQPKGLKMRYKPIGVEDSDDPDANPRLREAQKAPEFRVPTLPASSQSPKKRKRDEIIDTGTEKAIGPTRKAAKSKQTAKPNGEVRLREDGRLNPENGTTLFTGSPPKTVAKSKPAGKPNGKVEEQEDARSSQENGTTSSSPKKQKIEPSPSQKDKLPDPTSETQSFTPKKQRRKHKTLPPHEVTNADGITTQASIQSSAKVFPQPQMPIPVKRASEPPTAKEAPPDSAQKKHEPDPAKSQLSKKSKIPGETVEERRIRRAAKKQRKQEAM